VVSYYLYLHWRNVSNIVAAPDQEYPYPTGTTGSRSLIVVFYQKLEKVSDCKRQTSSILEI
jgi:hypothetical protein